MTAVLDTGGVIPTGVGALGGELAVSVATRAELHFGPLVASHPTVRTGRLRRLRFRQRRFHPLPLGDAVAASDGELVAAGRQPRARAVELPLAPTAPAQGAPRRTRNPDHLVGVRVLLQVVPA